MKKVFIRKKQHNIGIITEVAIFFLLGILTTGILTWISENRLSGDSVTEQTEQRAAQIANEMERSVREFPAYPWLLSYWYAHADALEIEYDVEFGEGTRTEEKCRELTERHPGLQLKYVTEDQARALPEADQKLYAEIAYSWMTTRINQIMRAHDVDYLFCVASKEPYDRQFFLLSGAQEGAARGTRYMEVYPLGNTVTVSKSQQEAMAKAYKHSSHLADAGDYVDYYTYFSSFDGGEVFIGMTYSLDWLRDDVKEKTFYGTTYAVLNQTLLSIICLALISHFVLRPLRGVQKNIRLYRETKDSRDVIRNLEQIHSRNEIGQLSEDVADLAMEIDDYLDRIRSITAERERISTELELATRIQADMLPNEFPAFPDRTEFDIFASMDPAREVGGDFYDFFLIDKDHFCMVIADVSGKGIPAALFMMASKIVLANNAQMGKSPAQILADTNAAICANNEEEMFVTVWLGILEISTGKLTAASAGHEYPVIKKADGPFEILKDRHGLPLGAMENAKYTEYELQLDPGSKLFVYTDGVPEATDARNELFGTDRMLAALNEGRDEPPEAILKTVRLRVDAFVEKAEQFDDLTMLCVEYHGV